MNNSTLHYRNKLDQNAETFTRLPRGKFNTTAKKICTYRGPEFCPLAAEFQRRKGVANPETHPNAITHPLTWLTEEILETGLCFRGDGNQVTKTAFENKFRGIIERQGCTRKAISKKHAVYAITMSEFNEALLTMVMHHYHPGRGNPQIKIRTLEDADAIFKKLQYRWGKAPSLWGETFITDDPEITESKYEIIPASNSKPTFWQYLTKLLYNLVSPFITAYQAVKSVGSKLLGGIINV